MYNIVLISPSLLTSCLHTDTLSQLPSQSSKVQGDKKDSEALGNAITQTTHTSASQSIYSNLPPFGSLKKKIFSTNSKKIIRIIIIINNSNNNRTTWRVLVHERPPNKPGHAAFGNKHQPFPPCSKNSKWRGPHSPHPPPAPQVGIKALDTNWWLSNQSAWVSSLFLCKLWFWKEKMKLQFLLMVFKTTTRRFWKQVFNHRGKSRTHFLLLSRIGFD